MTIHIVATDDEDTWEDPYWVMLCGMVLRPTDKDPGLEPSDHDFVLSQKGATCPACRSFEARAAKTKKDAKELLDA